VEPVSSDQIYQRVRALPRLCSAGARKRATASALIGEKSLGVGCHGLRTLAIGAVNVPIYPTLTGEQVGALVRDAGCRIAIVSTRSN